MLLAHRSGLFDYFRHQGLRQAGVRRPDHAWTTDEILALDGPAQYAPGTGFSYSNTNYVLLGLILEQVTGQPLATLIHDQLLAPLGLDETVFQQAGQPVGLVGAKGFWKSGRASGNGPTAPTSGRRRPTATVAWAAGAMEGSVRDLLDWEMALYGGEVLTPDELAEMLDFYQGLGLRPGRPDPDGGRRAGLRPRRLAARLPGGHVPAAGRGPGRGRARQRRASPTWTGSPTGWPRPSLNPLPTPEPSVASRAARRGPAGLPGACRAVKVP